MDVSGFLALMDLEPAGPDRWLAHSPDNGWKRVFGGQVLAQGLIAAERSVEGRAAHSLHAYFILSGDPAEPIELVVERVRDGGSFSVRRVVARQRGETMFVMSVSFQIEEKGALNHALHNAGRHGAGGDATPRRRFSRRTCRSPQAARGARVFDSACKPIECVQLDQRRYRPQTPGVFGRPQARKTLDPSLLGRCPTIHPVVPERAGLFCQT